MGILLFFVFVLFLFLFWASTLISHLLFIGLKGRKMTGMYTGMDFRRGFECWARHLILFLFFIHKIFSFFST